MQTVERTLPNVECRDVTLGVHNELSPWADELQTYLLRSKMTEKLSVGQLVDVSPDHSTVVFEKLDEHGFHCLFLWNVNVRKIEPMVSLWESDPGSGRGWHCRWSEDSQAIHITGSCGGFTKNEKRRYTKLDLIYLVKQKKFYSATEYRRQ
jgi:hypothetical protein